MGESSNFSQPSIPKFDGDYDHWSLLMENLLRSKEYFVVVRDGVSEPANEETLTEAQKKVLNDARLKDLKAKNYLFSAIDKSILKTITLKDNLKSLVVGSANYPEEEGVHYLSGPRHFLSSLESVEIERPLKGEVMEMKLVSYLLENSTILKKLTLCLDDSIKTEGSVILKELRTISRLSTSCQVVVL